MKKEKKVKRKILENTEKIIAILNNQNNPETSSEWLTSAEVCSILNISKRTLQNYRDQERIGFAKLHGRKILYKKIEIEKFLESHYLNLRKVQNES